MAGEVRFAADLYQGTAAAYDQCRLPYPAAMTTDLIQRAQVSGHGRLLDLACGTGQLAFPLCQRFTEVWSVDQEPDMVEVVRAKAAAQPVPNLRPVVSSAETLTADPGYFELAVIGNAFHRLNRERTAGLAGLIRSTSFLPAAVLGDRAAAFDADLAASLAAHSDDGTFTETISFAYELAQKPG